MYPLDYRNATDKRTHISHVCDPGLCFYSALSTKYLLGQAPYKKVWLLLTITSARRKYQEVPGRYLLLPKGSYR